MAEGRDSGGARLAGACRPAWGQACTASDLLRRTRRGGLGRAFRGLRDRLRGRLWMRRGRRGELGSVGDGGRSRSGCSHQCLQQVEQHRQHRTERRQHRQQRSRTGRLFFGVGCDLRRSVRRLHSRSRSLNAAATSRRAWTCSGRPRRLSPGRVVLGRPGVVRRILQLHDPGPPPKPIARCRLRPHAPIIGNAACTQLPNSIQSEESNGANNPADTTYPPITIINGPSGTLVSHRRAFDQWGLRLRAALVLFLP